MRMGWMWVATVGEFLVGWNRGFRGILKGYTVVRGILRGGLRDPHIPVKVRVMLRLAPKLHTEWFYVLVLHATLYSKCSIVLHCIAGYTGVSLLVC